MNNISPVNAYTEKNTAISYQSYEIEMNMFNKVTKKAIQRGYIIMLKRLISTLS